MAKAIINIKYPLLARIGLFIFGLCMIALCFSPLMWGGDIEFIFGFFFTMALGIACIAIGIMAKTDVPVNMGSFSRFVNNFLNLSYSLGLFLLSLILLITACAVWKSDMTTSLIIGAIAVFLFLMSIVLATIRYKSAKK